MRNRHQLKMKTAQEANLSKKSGDIVWFHIHKETQEKFVCNDNNEKGLILKEHMRFAQIPQNILLYFNVYAKNV